MDLKPCRCVLAIGSCCSIGLMGDSFDELSDWLEDLEPILEPLSLCASILCSSPSSLIFEAGHAMNEWASETGTSQPSLKKSSEIVLITIQGLLPLKLQIPVSQLACVKIIQISSSCLISEEEFYLHMQSKHM